MLQINRTLVTIAGLKHDADPTAKQLMGSKTQSVVTISIATIDSIDGDISRSVSEPSNPEEPEPFTTGGASSGHLIESEAMNEAASMETGDAPRTPSTDKVNLEDDATDEEDPFEINTELERENRSSIFTSPLEERRKKAPKRVMQALSYARLLEDRVSALEARVASLKSEVSYI